MVGSYDQFRARFSEEACLAEMMRLRFGGDALACPACGERGRFRAATRRRAFACEGCGHSVYPCQGTPFAGLRTDLAVWFFAVGLARSGRPVARELEAQAGLARPVATRVESQLKAFAAQAGAGLLDGIAAFVGAQSPGAAAVASVAAAPKRASRRGAGGGRAPGLLPIAASVAAVLVTGSAILFVHQRSDGPSSRAERHDYPDLSPAAPLPSLTIAAVEEEVAGAKQAVEAVIEAEKKRPEPPPPVAGPAKPAFDPGVARTGDPNEVLTFGAVRVRRHLVETIVRASRVVGADPTLLMAIADKESSFATEVKARTSSATGLYQFIERTWLGVVAEFGAKHGLEREARLVARGPSGYTVPDQAERARILDLRREPYLSALMAGEMLKRDTLRIEQRLGRHLSAGEIYLLHFLGPGAAQDLINAVESRPGADAAEMFPSPAKANQPIFFQNGRAKSVAEIRKDFDRMMGQRLDRFRAVRQIGGRPS